MRQIDQDNADLDISSEATVFTGTVDASNPRLVMVDVALGDGSKDLDGTGGDFVLKVEIGGVVFDGATQAKTVDASTTRARFQTVMLLVPANATLAVKVTSPNAGDSDVDCTGTVYDVAPLQPTTAARTLDITTGGAAGIDWGNVENPTTVVALSSTTVDLVDSPNSTAVTAIGTSLEAMMLDEGDASALLAAIAAKVEAFIEDEGDADATLAAIATAVWANATRTLTSAANITSDASAISMSSSGVVGTVNLVNTVTTNTDMVSEPDNASIGSILSAIGTPAADLAADIAAVKADTAAVLVDTNELQGDWTDGGRLDALLDAVNAAVYVALIEFTQDASADEFTVTWFKNGAPVDSGITSPTIQIVKRADGTDLVAETAMTEIGSTAGYKYDEATNRLTDGEAVLVIVGATIDGGGRTFRAIMTRDA